MSRKNSCKHQEINKKNPNNLSHHIWYQEATIFQISGITKTLSLWLFFKKPAHIIVGESGEEKKLIGNCNGNKIGSADWHGDIIPVNASQRLSKNCQQPTASNRS
jgi:hypothetical protein